MEPKIETTTLLNYIEIYNKYEYLIEKYTIEICPEFISNEDFIQDAKLGLLDYIENDKSIMTSDSISLKNNIYKYIKKYIKNLYLKYSKDIESNICPYDSVDIVYIDNYDKYDIQEILDIMINTLPENHARIIRMYYFDDLSMKAIASIENLSSSRISQIIHKSLRLLRRAPKSKQLKVYIEN